MKETARILKENDNFLIITHKKPDGDTTGSASALCKALIKFGKNAHILENPEITEKYAYLIKPHYPTQQFVAQFTILVDMASETLRTENAKNYQMDLCIDHHQSNSFFAKKTCLLDMGSCGEVIYEVIKELEIELDKDIAEGIFVAISTDTGCFRFANTTAHTHMVATKCLETGFNATKTNKRLFETKSRARINIEKYAYENLRYYDDNTIAILYLSQKTINDAGATFDDIDSISALPRQIEGVDVGLTMIEQADKSIKVSIRTTTNANANIIASKLGGGGHIRASGVSLHLDELEAIDILISAVRASYV